MGQLLHMATPLVFVLLWSTGFIGSKLGAPYAEPFAFLTLRFLLVLPAMALIMLSNNARLPTSWSDRLHCVMAGALIHGLYLGGVFWAIDQGMPAGIAALVLGLQPLLTTVFASRFLDEPLGPRHWSGLLLGAAGLGFVIFPRLGLAHSGVGGETIGAVLLAVVAISAGTVYQKRFTAKINLLANTSLQYLGAIAVVLPLSLLESWKIEWSGQFIFAIGWLTLVLSIGAILLLMLLIRQGDISQVSALFYLVPAAAAVESYYLFGETLTLPQIAGMALIMGAIIIIRRQPLPRR